MCFHSDLVASWPILEASWRTRGPPWRIWKHLGSIFGVAQTSQTVPKNLKVRLILIIFEISEIKTFLDAHGHVSGATWSHLKQFWRRLSDILLPSTAVLDSSGSLLASKTPPSPPQKNHEILMVFQYFLGLRIYLSSTALDAS